VSAFAGQDNWWHAGRITVALLPQSGKGIYWSFDPG